MATTTTYDFSADLDAQNDAALKLILKQRARGRVLVLGLLGAALLGLLAMTYAMYARQPAAPPYRTGTSDIAPWDSAPPAVHAYRDRLRLAGAC